MRRIVLALFALLALAGALPGGSVVGGAARAGAQPADDPRRGLVFAGLQRRTAGACAGAFEAVVQRRLSRRGLDAVCTHGPDPAPDGIDVRQDRSPATAAAAATAVATGASAASAGCYGTGSDGYRVQLVYAHSSTKTDRYLAYASSFQTWAANLDKVVSDSAAETGGSRHVRFVTDASCTPVVERVTLTSAGSKDFGTMVSELRTQGYARTDRKYLVWVDANTYCGISQVYDDDRADPTPGVNYSNGYAQVPGEVARVDNSCWGLANPVEAHELLHVLGGVQPSAPHATPGYHCTDESDRLCYADGSVPASAIEQVCPNHEALYDCGHDDYFSTAPLPDSYLATHWNTANSAFLAGSPSGATTTTTSTTTTTLPPTTTTTLAPSTTTTSAVTTTTTPPATSTSTTTTPTTVAPTGTAPSAPQGLVASQPATGGGIVLTWQPPAVGTATGYRIYRGATPYSLSFLVAAGTSPTYTDTSVTAGSFFYYTVTAVAGGAESPPSNMTGMVAK